MSTACVNRAMAERLGQEYWCFLADPATRSRDRNDIFLPRETLASAVDRVYLDRAPSR
jgi:hypothetical protein